MSGKRVQPPVVAGGTLSLPAKDSCECSVALPTGFGLLAFRQGVLDRSRATEPARRAAARSMPGLRLKGMDVLILPAPQSFL
jgi:hypothetical protein